MQLVMATRTPAKFDAELADWIAYGASPRGSIALDRCARAHAWLAGRDFVSPEDIQAVLFDVLRHRIILSFEAEAAGIDGTGWSSASSTLSLSPDPMPTAHLTEPGIRIGLAELIDMRHRVREIQLFSRPGQRSPLVGLHHSSCADAAWTSTSAGLPSRRRRAQHRLARHRAHPGAAYQAVPRGARTADLHLVEQSQRLFFGSGLMFKSVLAAQAAALFGWAALGHNDRIGGLVFGDNEHHEIKPRRSKQSLLQLLNRLAKVNQSLHTEAVPQPDSLGLALRRAREVLRPGSLAIIICDERALTLVSSST